jgi:hypothetical protein
LNLRNEALHGFVGDIDQASAVAVIVAVLYLAALQPGAR